METKMMFTVVMFPESQDFEAREGFYDNAMLINGEKSLETYGGSAYLVDTKYYDDVKAGNIPYAENNNEDCMLDEDNIICDDNAIDIMLTIPYHNS